MLCGLQGFHYEDLLVVCRVSTWGFITTCPLSGFTRTNFWNSQPVGMIIQVLFRYAQLNTQDFRVVFSYLDRRQHGFHHRNAAWNCWFSIVDMVHHLVHWIKRRDDHLQIGGHGWPLDCESNRIGWSTPLIISPDFFKEQIWGPPSDECGGLSTLLGRVTRGGAGEPRSIESHGGVANHRPQGELELWESPSTWLLSISLGSP